LAMRRLPCSSPLVCARIRRLFRDLLVVGLDAEWQGRLRGHLLGCEPCSVVLAEAIDRALARGTLVRPTVPPLGRPPRLLGGDGAALTWPWGVDPQNTGRPGARFFDRERTQD
jgi:hypothetical protein